MDTRTITTYHISAFKRHLLESEKSEATVEKYLRSVRQFASWVNGGEVTKMRVADWKERLLAQGCRPSTVNGKLTALDGLFKFLGWDGCGVKHLRLQRKMFRDSSRDLTREEYSRLTCVAGRTGRERLALLMETICSTGIRVSELRYITVEAARTGRTEISLKGKIRTIFLPKKLCRKLLKYARKQKTASGEVFLTRGGRSMDRRRIWSEMKALCSAAGVEPSKVFPHNLRHLFAVCFYRVCRDVVRLADVLGHSSIETTRIYLISTGAEHVRTLNQLHLIS